MVELNDFANPQTRPKEYKVQKLQTQYRSLSCIGEIYSKYCYAGILQHSRGMIPTGKIVLDNSRCLKPLTIVKYPVSDYESIFKAKPLGKSSYHVYSAILAFEFVRFIATKNASSNSLLRIGVITPYRSQADIVQHLIQNTDFPNNVSACAGTIHGFQGDECETILALFNPTPGMIPKSFFNNKNIVNVAVSRAKDSFVLLMPDSKTKNIENMIEVRKIEKLMHSQGKEICDLISAAEIEKAIFGKEDFIEENTFITGHQTVNVYGIPEKRYEIRSEENALDVQILATK